ncbi:MAG: GNAT family N-acetyltransferase [Acidimicrobiales bacterium]
MTITMYGADWCGDCRRAKAYFADNDVSYDYVDLEQTPEATEIVLAHNNGLKRIPVIVFDDGSHLTEPSNEALANKLASLNGSAEPFDFEIIESRDEARFELLRDGELVGFARYEQRGTTIVVPHVETLVEHRGQGYAAKLMDGLLDILRSEDRTIAPLCPFAAGHIRDNAEHHDLLA